MKGYRSSFDPLVARLQESPTTLTERELLGPSHWSRGEDARLREDLRFRQSPWGRWMLAEDLVANDVVYRRLHADRRGSIVLDSALARAHEVFGRRCVFCPDDPRFVLRGAQVHLSATELSRQPVVEDTVSDLEKYTTHLPLHTLRAAAASAPAGEWVRRAQDEVIETLGWVRVMLPGRRLNGRMFIAAVEGHSMDDGRSGLVDGGYAVFELSPSGTRQGLNVLVRGSFADPDTGNYAVKHYVADERGADGRHQRIALVSLNPDKARYPDIELQPDQDDNIVVVAKVVQALSTEDYERRPKARYRPGRRILTADEQSMRLSRRVASFFDGTPSDHEDGTTTATSMAGWQVRLIAVEAEAGGLQLEVGPLEGLPSFVKKLRVAGNQGWDGVVLAANARTRPIRVPIQPATGPWRWEPLGFEEEQDLGLEKLSLAAIDVTSPAVFRVDAESVGRYTGSRTLSFGQAYRLLLPPGIGGQFGSELDAGWRLWSLELATLPAPETRLALTSLGLDIGDACPRLEWALGPAAAWRVNPRGESYPVFEAGSEVFVSVIGSASVEEEELSLFLHGPAGTERLPSSSDGLVSLGAPVVGRWACALLHSRTSVPSATLPFEVAEDAVGHVRAECAAVAHSGLPSLEAVAPPGWPVTLRWRDSASSEDVLATLYGEDDGTLPVDAVAPTIEARASRTRVADLTADFAELGYRTVLHDGRASLSHVRERLAALWQQRSGLIHARKGAWMQLRSLWFEPMSELLGYALGPSPVLADDAAPHDLAAWGLTVDERVDGDISRSASRVLVLTTSIEAVLHDHRAWIDRACLVAKVRDAIVTDGTSWTTHRKGSQQLKQQVWSLDTVIERGQLDEMLGDLAEGL
jgi:hypothetical protein